MPASYAFAIKFIISFLSLGLPWFALIPIHPSPKADTLKSFPKIRFGMPALLSSAIIFAPFKPSTAPALSSDIVFKNSLRFIISSNAI